MNTPYPSQWQKLFTVALNIIDNAGGDSVVAPWSFGGGTALMLQIDHRESHDVDLFVDDPQVLPLLNPETQEYSLSIVPSAYQYDGTRSLKIVFDNIGEIDFVCCGHITTCPTFTKEICGRSVEIETPGEILAKKIYYRGQHVQARDIFDLVATCRAVGFDSIAPKLRQVRSECAITLEKIKGMDANFARLQMAQLMAIRPDFQDIPDVGQPEAIDILSKMTET